MFQSGNSQAVDCPPASAFKARRSRFSAGAMNRAASDRTHDLTAAFALLTELPIDELVREDAPPQDRDGL